ncbi:MAG: hypothetical protein M1348_03005 [Candidatus Parvarchaeota archaeon]|nr:hypothetical protein [Candidatus Parvarchaeota archaeon]MCL5101554.1 hypothetical protein [Candidatus Parvarchaeota archaeon]
MVKYNDKYEENIGCASEPSKDVSTPEKRGLHYIVSSLSDHISNWKQMRKIRQFNDNSVVGIVRKALDYTAPETSKILYERKLAGITPTKAGEVEVFYRTFFDMLSEASNELCDTGVSADSLKYLTERQLSKKILPNLDRIIEGSGAGHISRAKINRRYGIYAPQDGQITLSGAEVYGLIASALVNYSDAIKKVKLKDNGHDYLGAFLWSGKEMVIRPETGIHLGYMRNEGSEVWAQKAIDLTKRKGLARIAYEEFGNAAKAVMLRIFPGMIGGFTAAVSAIDTVAGEGYLKLPTQLVNYSGTIPIGFATEYFTLFSLALLLPTLVAFGIQDTISKYKQDCLKPDKQPDC